MFEDLELKDPNGTVAYLKSPEWQTLLDRIGDGMMQFLLQHVFLFEKLQNGCYLQLTGTVVNSLFNRNSVVHIERNKRSAM